MVLALAPAPYMLLLLWFLCLSCADTSSPPVPTSAPPTHPDPTSETPTPPPEHNATGAECLIDNQMALIAVGSAGGLIVCLLLTVVTLACQVCHLQRKVYIPRSSRSNLDLCGSAGYWENAAATMEREADLVMEEVKTGEQEEEREELGEIREEEEEEVDEEEEEAEGVSPEEKPLMHSSESRESDMPLDLEDMPLVV